MNPRTARYLLRFDDLCPTMARAPWLGVEQILREFSIRPILAAVPENCDPDLEIDPSDPGFWDRMRAWEQSGASVALHGYRHHCIHRGRSLIPLHRLTEFAGVAAETQLAWLRAGKADLHREGLHPKIFVAPRHGFDVNTLWALRQVEIDIISDGMAQVPTRRGGIVWLPQQLWEPVEKPAGLWTICLHSNAMDAGGIARLRAFCERNQEQILSPEQALAEFPPRPLRLTEALKEKSVLMRLQTRRWGSKSCAVSIGSKTRIK
ncbi:MAG TPA: DUF2334 domain-containing protein [Terracidiphilus sp.]|nr:DUF2334 domain-containing protein [Terracidiphilus sp.]